MEHNNQFVVYSNLNFNKLLDTIREFVIFAKLDYKVHVLYFTGSEDVFMITQEKYPYLSPKGYDVAVDNNRANEGE